MKMMRKFVIFLTVLALTVSCFAMTAAATAEEDNIPAESAPVETTPEPEPTEPEPTEPEVTEPEATEPEATEPEATEPEPTEPEATEPETGEEAEIGPELNGTDGTGEESTAAESGTCGDNLTWTLDSSGVFRLYGNGPMPNYTQASPAPWHGLSINVVELETGITSVGDYAFYECTAQEIYLPNTIKTIGKYALSHTNVVALVIPEGVTTISDYAISDNSEITDLLLPSTLKTIGEHAFARCHFTYAEIPDSVTSLGKYAFYSCPYLEYLYISGGLTTIREWTFQYCANLDFVILPASVTRIEAYAFADCGTISEGYYLGTEKQFYEISFGAGNGSLEGANWYLATIATKNPEDVTTSDGMTVSFSAAASRDNCTYQWYFLEDGTEEWDICTGTSAAKPTYTFTAFEYMSGRLYSCLITDEFGSEFWSTGALLTVLPAPKFTSQPQNAKARSGETVTTSVEATGEELTYTWYFTSDAADTTFSKSSVTTDTYSTTMDVSRDGRKVYCVVTDKFGNTAKSDTAVLTLEKSPIAIRQQPEDVIAESGKTASVHVEATGDGLTYTWYYTSGGSASTFSKSSVTSATYSITMDAIRDGRKVYCVITDIHGQSVTTRTATMNMKTVLAIVQQPVNATAYTGSQASVTVKAVGDGLTYQWYAAEKDSDTFLPVAGATGATFSVTMDEAADGIRVYCALSDAYGNSAVTDTVKLSGRTALRILTQPESVSVQAGETASVKVEAVGDGLTYAWYFAARGSSRFSMSSIATDTYTSEMTDARDGRQIYCKITDAYGNVVTTKTVSLTMYVPLVITRQPVSVAVADGTLAKVTVAATGKDITYQWYYRNPGAAAFTASSYKSTTYSATMTEARDGRQVYCVITDADGNSVTTDTVTLSMKEKTPLAIVSQPKSVTVTEGESAKATVEASGDGLSYSWYFTSNGKSSKFSKSSITSATYSAVMNADRDGRKIYCVITDAYGKTVKTNTVTLSMTQPDRTPLTIVTEPVSVTVSEGETAAATVEATGDGLKYTWYYTTGGSATKFYKSGTVAKTYSVKMDESRNGRKIYCVITDKYGNTVTTETVTLSMIQPERTPLAIVTQPASVTVAQGETAAATVEATGDGLTYTWYYTTSGSATRFFKSGTVSKTYSVKMDESRDGRKIYCVITDKYGNTVTTETVTLRMIQPDRTPLAIVTQPTSVSVANGKTAATSVEATGDGLTYTWYFTSGGSSTRFNKSSITSATYSTVMNADRDGRKIYCVITDRYGSSVTTATVTLSMTQGAAGTALKIVSQPTSVTVEEGQTATATVEATGDGLTYEWYYTSNGNSTRFFKSSNTTATYSTVMDATRDGRRVYCVIADANGNSVISDTVVLSMEGGDPTVRTVTAASLTIRATPGLSGKVVGYLYAGDVVTVSETKAADGYTWGKIANGWIALEFTK